MSDEEKQAIERLRQLPVTLAIKHLGGAEEISTALNLIERQQREKQLHIKLEQQYKKEYLDTKERIEELQMTLARYTAQTLNADIKQMHKHNEDLEMLYKGCQIEIEKKDKIIDEMAKYIGELDIDEDICRNKDCDEYTNIYTGEIDCKNCIKEYFKNKVGKM